MLSQIKTGLDGSRWGIATPGELCRSVSIAAVWAGNDPATARFVELKKKRAESIGIKIIIFILIVATRKKDNKQNSGVVRR